MANLRLAGAHFDLDGSIGQVQNDDANRLNGEIQGLKTSTGIANEKLSRIGGELSGIKSIYEEATRGERGAKTSVLDRVLDLLFANDRWSDIRVMADLVPKIDDQNQSALNYLGQYYEQSEADCPQALKCYRRSLSVNSSNIYAADAFVFQGAVMMSGYLSLTSRRSLVHPCCGVVGDLQVDLQVK